MRRYRYAAVALAGALLALVQAGPANAAVVPVLTTGSLGGTPVAVGDTLVASLATGTVAAFRSTAGGSSGIDCATSSFTATVVTNPDAPGVATESLTAQTFGNCTPRSIFGVLGVGSVTVGFLPYSVAVDDATFGLTVSGAPLQTTIVLNTLLGTITCVYQAVGGAISGTSNNTTNSIAFAGQKFTRSSGPALCFANGFFTATYAPVLDTSQPGSPAVFVN